MRSLGHLLRFQGTVDRRASKARGGSQDTPSETTAHARPDARWRPLLAMLVAGAALLFLVRIGATDLWAPDEPRYAQVAEEMRSFEHGPGGLVLLHLNGAPYTQKPPLYFWLAALAGSAGGRVSETAARLPSALAGIATVAVTASLGRALFASPATGLWSGALLLCGVRFGHLARRVQLDVLLTLFASIALLAFWRLENERGSRRGNLALLHGALALGVLTKGPVGLLPLVAIGIYLVWERRGRDLRGIVPPRWLALSFLPGLVWIAAAVALAPPDFFREAVVENLWGRFFAGTSHARPIHYYVFQLPIDFLPWTLLWPAAVVAAARALRRPAGAEPGDRRAWRLILSCVGVWFVVLSSSAGKRGLYLLPLFPVLAIACAAGLRARLAASPRSVLSRATAVALLVAVATGGAALVWNAGFAIPGYPGFAIPPAFGWACLAIATAGAAALAIPLGRAAPASRDAMVSVAAVGLLELAAFAIVLPAFDAEKSPRPIAALAAERSAPDRPIGVFGHRAMIGGIAYYADRPVIGLESPADARRFIEAGGGAIVVKATRFDSLRPAADLEVRGRLRSGARRVLVVTARSSTR